MTATLELDAFDDLARFEAAHKGRWPAHVVLADGRRFCVTFYDLARLAQDLESSQSLGEAYVAEPGMIVVPEVTLEHMTAAVRQLADEGYFERLAPLAAPTTRA